MPPPQASGGLGFTPKLPPPQAYSLARITARLESPCCRGSPSISLAAPSAALVRVSVRARVREKECRVARICTHTRDKAQRHMSSESLHAARRARTRRRPGEGAARAGEEGGLCDMCGTICGTACASACVLMAHTCSRRSCMHINAECSRSCVHIKTHIVKHVMTRAHLEKDLYAHRHHARHLRARFQLPAAGAGLESRGYVRVEGGRYNAGVGLCISRLR